MKNWMKNLEKLKRFRQIYQHANVPPDWDMDPVLAQWVKNIRVSKRNLPTELSHELEKLGFNFEYKEEKGWETMYSQLISFRKKYGHTRVPVTEPYEELSEWTAKLRIIKTKLPDKQIALLDELGFSWQSLHKKKDNWELMCSELKEFREEHGHTKVLRSDKEHPQLATWVANIRARHHLLTPNQKKRLDSLGFLWKEDVAKQVETQWLMHYRELKEFKKRFGHCNVPIKWKENKKLSQWVSENRLRQKNKGLLPGRKKLLDKIGFSWSEDLVKLYDTGWNQMFRRLKEYKARFGHLRVLAKRDNELKSWVASQRMMIKIGRLSSEKRESLESVGFLSKDVHGYQWEKMYQELKQYISKYDNADRIQRHKYPSLGSWVVLQRKNYVNGTLEEERIRKLNKIGFLWAPRFQEKAWTAMYLQLVQFKKTFNHVRVPGSIPKYEKLSSWVSRQRTRWKEKRLSKEEYRLLNTLGFDWDVLNVLWESAFEELVLFKKQFNHLKVPYKTYPTLFGWISKQKQKYKTGKLDLDHVRKLKSIGFNLNLRWRVTKQA